MSDMKTKIRAIKALEDAEGRVTAEGLVKAAKNPRHPMHKDFNWNDRIAGHLHRLETARKIIASVPIYFRTETKHIKSVAYVRDVSLPTDQQGYRSITRIVDEDDLANKTLEQEIERVKSLMDRAQEIAEALGLFEEYKTAMNSINALLNALHSKRAAA